MVDNQWSLEEEYAMSRFECHETNCVEDFSSQEELDDHRRQKHSQRTHEDLGNGYCACGAVLTPDHKWFNLPRIGGV